VSLSRADFDAISEADLLELIDGKVPEDHRLDYKRDIYGQSDKDKKELLKDVSAFANVSGGTIVIGIDEAAGVAARICGVKPLDIGAEVLRMEQILSTGIEPRIPG
jgi:predicted HTH transcriptional regulator